MSTKLTRITRRTKKVLRAEHILTTQKNRLRLKMTPLSYILSQLKEVAVKEEVLLCTDGEVLYYNPDVVIEDGGTEIEKVLCHIILHGLLGHFEEAKEAQKYVKLMSAVKDLQAERAMQFLRPGESRNVLTEALEYYNYEFSDEEIFGNAIYYKARKNRELYELLCAEGEYYKVDDHRYWMHQKTTERTIEKKSTDKKNLWEEARTLLLGYGERKKAIADASGRERMMYTLCSKQYGTARAREIRRIKIMTEAETAYEVLLKEIMAVTERSKEEDEIDKALYTYGLQLYGNIPLVEPTECNEVRNLNTMIIALDTSSSCEERVPLFLSEVRKMFSDIQEQFMVESIYVIQCDNRIQKEEKYENVSGFLYTDSEEEVIGGGGTDFVPVFDRVKEIEKSEKVDVLFYLTDGLGEYPKGDAPDYPVYFLLSPEEVSELGKYACDEVWVPEWINIHPIVMKGEMKE